MSKIRTYLFVQNLPCFVKMHILNKRHEQLTDINKMLLSRNEILQTTQILVCQFLDDNLVQNLCEMAIKPRQFCHNWSKHVMLISLRDGM